LISFDEVIPRLKPVGTYMYISDFNGLQ